MLNESWSCYIISWDVVCCEMCGGAVGQKQIVWFLHFAIEKMKKHVLCSLYSLFPFL